MQIKQRYPSALLFPKKSLLLKRQTQEDCNYVVNYTSDKESKMACKNYNMIIKSPPPSHHMQNALPRAGISQSLNGDLCGASYA